MQYALHYIKTRGVGRKGDGTRRILSGMGLDLEGGLGGGYVSACPRSGRCGPWITPNGEGV
jgi:hypothetical protein